MLISQGGNSELSRIRLSAVAKILAYEQKFMVKKIRLARERISPRHSISSRSRKLSSINTITKGLHAVLTSVLAYWWWSSTEVNLSRKCLKQMSMCKFVTLHCLSQNYFSWCSRDLSVYVCIYVCMYVLHRQSLMLPCVVYFRFFPQGRQEMLEEVRVQSADWKTFILYHSEFSKILNN